MIARTIMAEGRWRSAARAGCMAALGVLAILTLLPGDEANRVRAGAYAVGIANEHVLAYALAALALGAGYARDPRDGARLALALAGYGTVLEALQMFVPGRTANVADAIENVIGAVLGMAALVLARVLATRSRALR